MENPRSIHIPETQSPSSVENGCLETSNSTKMKALVILNAENGYELPEGFEPEYDNQALKYGHNGCHG